MSHPIDVGSVLGGRYKVTATVLTSHDQDLVLDGVDQVLNRAVSILVAGPDNADQVAKSAREVATGERPGHVQILDLGVSDLTTYLITNHTSAADLLDLVVSSNPPYVEPFFTDTLGSEIFGHARSKEPETYDGLYDDEEVDAGYIDYGQQPRGAAAPASPPVQPSHEPLHPTSPPSPPAGTAAAAAAGMVAASGQKKSPKTAPQKASPHTTAPQPVQAAGASQPTTMQPDVPSAPAQTTPEAAGDRPKVSLWSDDDYTYDGRAEQDHSPQQGQPVAANAAGGVLLPPEKDRTPRSFPAAARTAEPDEDDYKEDEGPGSEPRSKRWLIGGLLAAVLVAGLIFTVTNLGSLFKSSPPPAAGPSSASTPAASSGKPSSTASSAPAAGPPAVEGVTRSGDFDFAGAYDADLAKTFDGNGASYWSDMEFATDNWGGLATEVPLVVKLEGPSQVSSVTLSQLGASGGNISVLTNDRPSLEGAKQVGSNSFTSPDLTISLQEPVTAEYVIVSIKTLPKLAAPKTRYGFGLRLAEIKVQ